VVFSLFSPKNPLDLSIKPLIGMVHLPPLDISSPETSFEDIYLTGIQDAITLETAGFNAILIENFHDTPLNACVQALMIATINRGSFIRCNIYEGAYVTDQGIIESVAAEVQHKLKEIRSNVKILADVHVKHATPLGHFSLEEAATNAINREGASAIILSGRATGKLIDLEKLKNFVQSTKIKPILGSGLTIKNLSNVFPYISGAIVGSSIKVDKISSPIDIEKAKALTEEWKSHRQLKGDIK